MNSLPVDLTGAVMRTYPPDHLVVHLVSADAAGGEKTLCGKPNSPGMVEMVGSAAAGVFETHVVRCCDACFYELTLSRDGGVAELLRVHPDGAVASTLPAREGAIVAAARRLAAVFASGDVEGAAREVEQLLAARDARAALVLFANTAPLLDRAQLEAFASLLAFSFLHDRGGTFLAANEEEVAKAQNHPGEQTAAGKLTTGGTGSVPSLPSSSTLAPAIAQARASIAGEAVGVIVDLLAALNGDEVCAVSPRRLAALALLLAEAQERLPLNTFGDLAATTNLCAEVEALHDALAALLPAARCAVGADVRPTTPLDLPLPKGASRV